MGDGRRQGIVRWSHAAVKGPLPTVPGFHGPRPGGTSYGIMRDPVPTILATALLALAAPAQAQGDRSAPPGTVTCVIEAECLPDLARVARRVGPTLTLTLEDGSEKALKDNPGACPDVGAGDCATYLLSAYMPASGLILVDFQGHGTGGVLAVETRDGTSFELSTQPSFSPSGQLLVSTDDSQGRPYDITIWSRYQGQWIDVLRYSARDPSHEVWGLARWTGDELVTAPVSDATGAPRGEAKVTWDGQGWQMQVP